MAALAIVLAASSVRAQGYDYYRDDQAYAQNGPTERVEVIAPRIRPERGLLHGAQPARINLSDEVTASLSQLRTRSGARAFRQQIRYVARGICYDLRRAAPGPDDAASCYRDAVDDAMRHADAAIYRARYYAE